MPYSPIVMDHFQQPRNVGELAHPDAVGQVGNPGQGQFVIIHLQLERDTIMQAAFQTFGCGPAIAACSLLTEWVTGKSVAEARALTQEQLVELLGGLPEDKLFCAGLAVTALQQALRGRE
jgi:nitrogen fixation NifU-like protein